MHPANTTAIETTEEKDTHLERDHILNGQIQRFAQAARFQQRAHARNHADLS